MPFYCPASCIKTKGGIGVGQGGTKTLRHQACARAGSITLPHFDEMCLNAHGRMAARGWAQNNPNNGGRTGICNCI